MASASAASAQRMIVVAFISWHSRLSILDGLNKYLAHPNLVMAGLLSHP